MLIISLSNVVVFNTTFSVSSWNREKAEDDIYDFLEHIRPNGTTDTAIFSLQDYGKQFLDSISNCISISLCCL